MPLPSPNLDDRRFQDIVDETKREIGLRCPEWTDHNVSDPGVTLIELFASMAEQVLYRLNQVPERNYVKFLEMIGIHLQPPKNALVDIRLRLTSFLSDQSSQTHRIEAYRTSASTIRSELDEPLEFVAIEDLELSSPKLVSILSVPGRIVREGASEQRPGIRPYEFESLNHSPKKGESLEHFQVYQDRPEQDDSLYLGFDGKPSSHVIRIDLDGLPVAGTQLREDAPLQVWEYWDAHVGEWLLLEVVEDELYGFNQPASHIEVALPHDLAPQRINGLELTWIRCRYTMKESELSFYADSDIPIDAYEGSPMIRNVKASTVGGTYRSANCTPVFDEVLGESDGTPGQVFVLTFAPLLELGEQESKLLVVDPNDELGNSEWTTWSRVEDFASSTEDDRHFTLDLLSGEVSFGPNIPRTTGGALQYGAVPPKGHRIVFPRYCVGGGAAGNVRSDTIKVLRSAKDYVASITNPRPAQGGEDRETLEAAKMRAIEVLRIRNRAVTKEDFEFLAAKASPVVGRAHCLDPVRADSAQKNNAPSPGVITVLVVPQLPFDLFAPQPQDLVIEPHIIREVHQFLEERKLLTTQLNVREPEYVYVSTDVSIVVKGNRDPDRVALEVEEALYRMFHPTLGGHSGTGWPFERTVTISDVYAAVASVEGVSFLLNATMKKSLSVAGERERRTNPEDVDLKQGLVLQPHQMIVGRQHAVKVQPIWEAGRRT